MNRAGKFIPSVLLITLGLATSALAAITHTGKAVNQVTVVTESGTSSTGSTAFTDLPGASAVVKVPAGKTQLVQARFGAQSICFGNIGFSWCAIRLMADGVEMLPADGNNFAFDSTATNGQADTFFKALSMDRTLLLGPGTHTISAQWAVKDSGLSFQLDNWSLTVTQYANGH